MGYANKVIRLDFPDLSTGPDDPIWVIIRNPALLPAAELVIENGAFGDKGEVLDRDKAIEASHILASRLIVAARVYDARAESTYDPLTGAETADGSTLLQPPWTADSASRLPSQILTRISEAVGEANSPKPGPESGTPKTSSGPPSPSGTEPGEAGTPQPS